MPEARFDRSDTVVIQSSEKLSSTKEVYSDMFYYNTRDKTIKKKDSFARIEHEYGLNQKDSNGNSFSHISK